MEWTCEDLTVFSFFGIDHNDETEVHLCGDFFELGEELLVKCSNTNLDGDIHNESLSYVSGSSNEAANTITLNYESFQVTEGSNTRLTVQIVMTLEQVSATVAEVTHNYSITICNEDVEDCHIFLKFIHSTDADVDPTPDGSDSGGNENFIEYDASSEKLTYSEGGILYEVQVDSIASSTALDRVGICDEITEGGDECELLTQPTAGQLTLFPDADVPLTGPGDWDTGLEFDFTLGHVSGEGSGPLSHEITVIERIILPSGAPPPIASTPSSFRLLGHDNIDHTIIEINILTGNARVIGPTGFTSTGSGLAPSRIALETATSPDDPTPITQPAGTNFGIFMDMDDGEDYVVTINPTTGESTKIVKVVDGIGTVGVAFDKDGIFYGTTGGKSELYKIDLITGEKELVGIIKEGDTNIKGINNLQFNPDSEKFVALGSSSPPGIYEIDPADASAKKLSELKVPLASCSIARAPDTGEWFSVTSLTKQLVRLDIDTGDVFFIGPLGDASSGVVCGLAFEEVIRGTTGAAGHEPPTIGKALDGVRQVVDGGMAIDGQTWTVTQPYHQEFELLQMLSSPHTISNVIHCAKGVQYCNYIAVGFMGLTDDFNNPVMTVSASKDHQGTWTLNWFDPDDFISDPGDAVAGDIVFVPQIIDNNLLGTSFTIDFKNKDTGQLKLGIQVRDSYNGVRNFYFNEGVEFIDADAYPDVNAAYDEPIKVDPLCFGQNNPDRNSCAFAKIKDWATENAEETLRQMMGNQYEYEQ